MQGAPTENNVHTGRVVAEKMQQLLRNIQQKSMWRNVCLQCAYQIAQCLIV
jgi:hypothetical protein